MSRPKLTRAFLWLSVIAWGIGLGSKVFDLVVLASAWGASPASLAALYPYGRQWPINPGTFFQPLSALILIATLGALISGWNTEPKYRIWLWLPLVAFTLIWIATPTIFWPMINELYAIAHGRVTRTGAEVAVLIRHWFLYDWLRIAVLAVGYLSSIRALTLPGTAFAQHENSGTVTMAS